MGKRLKWMEQVALLKLWKMLKESRFKLSIIFIVTLLSHNVIAQISFGKNSITTGMDVVKKIVVADIDGDGDLDVVAAGAGSGSNIAWFENDGDMNFTPITITSSFPRCRSVATGDFDNDGDIDVVAGNTETEDVTWWTNDGSPTGPNWISNPLSGAGDSTYSVSVVDLDGDNDDDILASFLRGDSLGWYENVGSGNFIYRPIEYSYVGAVDLVAARIDNDSDLDLVGAAFFDDLISWWSQTSTGNFSSKTDVSSGFLSPNSIFAGDIDGDGDNDLLSAGHYNESGVSWWENTGNGSFGTEQIVISGYVDARNAVFQDVDSDGDMDIVACADEADDISWWENDGDENFTKRFVTTTFNYPYYVQSLDFDGDGDMDIIGSAEIADEIAWWENDLDDLHFTSGGDPGAISFYSGEVVIDFSSGTDGNTRVFFNANKNENRTSLGSGIDHIAAEGFFTIYTQKSAAAGDVTFDLSMIPHWSNYDNSSTLVICLWNSSNSQWEIAGTGESFSGTDLTVEGIDQDDLSAFSKWTIGSTNSDNPLPVNLISFQAIPLNNSIKVTWQTESEINNLGFELWRKTNDESKFSIITSYRDNDNLQGQGTSSFGNTYEFIDDFILNGQIYHYQLVDISYSGHKTFHQPITVNFLNDQLIKLEETLIPDKLELIQNFPNPFNANTQISFSLPDKYNGQTVQLSVYNELGQKIKTLYNNTLSSGQYVVEWDGTNDLAQPVSSGMYIYMVKSGINHIFKRMMLVK